jgi:hypothetical protein
MRNSWWRARGSRDDQSQDDQYRTSEERSTGTTRCCRILPFVEALRGLTVSVMVWGWKVAPVALYEALVLVGEDKEVIDTRSGRKMRRYLARTRWQKVLIVPWALGFYFFLYEKVALPLVFTLNCCASYFWTVLASLALITVHFVSGLYIHLRQHGQQQNSEHQNGQEHEGEVTSDFWLAGENNQQQGRDRGVSVAEYRNEGTQSKKQRFWPFVGKAHNSTGDSPTATSTSSAMI